VQIRSDGGRSACGRLGRSAFRPRRGITLMEAVVAIAIVGMTAVSALEAVGGDMRTAERAKRAIEVEALATSRLEVMNLLTDQELQSLPDSIEDGKFAAPLNEYTWKASSAPVSDQAGLYTVHVTVNWTNGAYELKTYMYRTPRLVTRR
jgi:type II secretory pathway pseudopilin PulG